jgi:hypothetical protein
MHEAPLVAAKFAGSIGGFLCQCVGGSQLLAAAMMDLEAREQDGSSSWAEAGLRNIGVTRMVRAYPYRSEQLRSGLSSEITSFFCLDSEFIWTHCDRSRATDCLSAIRHYFLSVAALFNQNTISNKFHLSS